MGKVARSERNFLEGYWVRRHLRSRSKESRKEWLTKTALGFACLRIYNRKRVFGTLLRKNESCKLSFLFSFVSPWHAVVSGAGNRRWDGSLDLYICTRFDQPKDDWISFLLKPWTRVAGLICFLFILLHPFFHFILLPFSSFSLLHIGLLLIFVMYCYIFWS